MLEQNIPYLNEVKHNFIEQDPNYQLDAKYFSASAMNSFADHSSSSRSVMFSSHMSQPVVIDDPDINMVQSGLEYDFAKYTISKYVDNPSEVVAIIKRYRSLDRNDESSTAETIVMFKDLTTGVLDALEIPTFNKLHPYFGYKFNTEKLSELSIGDTITSDDKLGASPSNIGDHDYGYGKDLNVIQMTIPAVDEDGFVISESCAKKFQFSVFDTRTIEVGESSFLLNLYGEDGDYKPLPDIGEKISDTGAIAVIRNYDEDFSPVAMGIEDVKKFNPIFDKAVYGRHPRSTIVDIKIHKNNKRKKTLPTGTEKYCEEYSDKLVNFYQQIINTYDSINDANKRSLGREVEVGNTLYTLLSEAYGVTEASKPNSKLRYKYRKDNVDLYRIEVTTETHFDRLFIGAKITDNIGGDLLTD